MDMALCLNPEIVLYALLVTYSPHEFSLSLSCRHCIDLRMLHN